MEVFRSILLLLSALALGFTATFASQNCQIQNVCFVLDQSGSISTTDYKKIQKFTIDTANAINVITKNVQYSAVAFSSSASTIQLPTKDLAGKFTTSINKDRIFNGGTNIFGGLRACLNILKGENTGGRVIVLVTDGQGAGISDPRPEIRQEKISVLSVGIGSGINEKFLKETASKPKYFTKTSFTDLNAIVKEIVKDTCEGGNESSGETPEPTVGYTPEPSPVVSSCDEAASRCDFRFQGSLSVPTFDISGPADKSFTPQIVSKDPKEILGVLNTNNIVPEFVFEYSAEPITAFANQPFTPTSFKPFTVGTGSGIGHQTFHGNQLQVASRKCVRVFFTEYQVLNSQGHVIGNFNNIPRSSNKCVVFLTN